MRKGIELPINILVIVAVAIIVLLGVIALFYSSWFSGTAPVTSQAAVTTACNQANRLGCATAPPLTLSVSYKTYTSLALYCVGEYPQAGWTVTPPAAGAAWNVGGVDAEKCLGLACGMSC